MITRFIKNKKFFRRYVTSPLLRGCCSILGVKPRRLYYDTIGVALGYQLDKSGETWFVKNVLPKRINNPKPVLLDVGANIGEFSALLHQAFPGATIHAFEPGPKTYLRLRQANVKNVKCHNFALGSKQAKATLYDSAEGDGAGASLLSAVHQHTVQKNRHSIHVDTIDHFLKKNHIKTIDFLKVDVEGFELEVLKGAKQAIAAGKANIILFEFNEMNVSSRVFLKDFYNLLTGYTFYRLHRKKLVPLGAYHTKNEIFEYQNIVAIR